ncbi:uncharacterized protein LOC116001307 [Ipomoea triloba]|uniref:uncharacterized protein LOC116001307 n=1 Tax=Ipomoea triloba TaxID=35885 RepID=UPI00125DEE4C|nr:uncharacterized protein LOC116001307 [Ipomoea triloba]
MRFRRKGKLSPRFIGPYEVLERIGNVAYRLSLPTELDKIVEMDESLTYEEKPIKILDTKTRETRRKVVKLVKALWLNHLTEEATWEVDDDMRNRYPTLFDQEVEFLLFRVFLVALWFCFEDEASFKQGRL